MGLPPVWAVVWLLPTPEGPPFEHYGEIQSGEAIRHASEILEFVRAQVA